MKKLIALICCAAALLTGCNKDLWLFKRISFSDEGLELVNKDAVVINNTDEDFPTQLPIYRIKEHKISQEEYQQLQEQVQNTEANISEQTWRLDNNCINGQLIPVGVGAATMSEEELEAMAWDTFNKITLLEGEYEYYGICGKQSVTDSKGEHITALAVSFCRVLDGVRIAGNDRCDMWFNDSGLTAITIGLYDYKAIGTMDMVPLEEAEARITTPDAFELKASCAADKLQVDRVRVYLYNQHYIGCNVLQPVYSFVGTATLEDGTQAEFNSKVIAIPEA